MTTVYVIKKLSLFLMKHIFPQKTLRVCKAQVCYNLFIWICSLVHSKYYP